ncbi:MAG TPA: anti-sigma factor [Planctomycetaceae bacterium]|jgi:anti-sigma factor RsiW|nr:anti-sigma factor [Planctomycetaceae bacterium]
MNCQEIQHLLDPYSDGELDLVRQLEIDEHLTTCTACAQQERQLKLLRETLSSPSLYYAAPAGLRARLQGVAAPASLTHERPQAWMRLFSIAAGILLLMGVSATIAVIVSRATTPDGRMTDWVLASHVRSLQVNHLTDVPSSDRHTVKPWFRDKLDFSPQVPNLTADGFTLLGGRLDYLAERPVAALVYQHGKHAINVFTWPAATSGERGVQKLSRQGFHVLHWQLAGMNYWVISDLNEEDLDRFRRAFFADAASGRP